MALSPVTFSRDLTAIFEDPKLNREDRRQLIAQELFRASNGPGDKIAFFRDLFEYLTIVNHNQDVRNGQLEEGTKKLESSNKACEARIAELEKALKERKVETQKSDGNTALIIGGVEIAVLVASLAVGVSADGKSTAIGRTLKQAASAADTEKLQRQIALFEAASKTGICTTAATLFAGPFVPGAVQLFSAWRTEKAEEKK
ncbi:MAG: hypothetical protein K1000chlam4_00587 [Chlamydiae bacterium]|nr:hypothetical protein [Chlamydiota bacterium]